MINQLFSVRRFMGGILFLLAMTAAARAQPALTTVTIAIPSKTASDWQTFVAERYGFFARNGIQPKLIVTGSSAGDVQRLTSSNADIAQVTTVTLVEAVQGGAPIVAVVNGSAGVPFFAVGRKGLTRLAQLKGKTISIGGPTDITRIFMDEMLARAGLHRNDFTYTYAGATSARYAALIDGRVDATLLFPPFVSRAVAQGYPLLANAAKYFPDFPFNTWAVRRQWANDHPALVTAFSRARNQAVRWLYDPANKERAIALLSEETKTSPRDAAAAYDVFITQVRYFVPSGMFAEKTFDSVVGAMLKAGMIASAAAPSATYYDNRFVRAANAKH